MTLVDTSGWVAVADTSDQKHEAAVVVWQRLRRERERLLVSDLILAEVAILLRRRAGHPIAVRAIDMILRSAVVELAYVDPTLLEEAFALFRRYRERELSLTDCASFALMRRRKLDSVFAFDEDFRVAGFRVLDG